jgi:HK97 gp10 family phage protein
MADTIRVELEGDKELLAKLALLGISTQMVLEAAVAAAAELVRDGARTMAPGPHVELEVTRSSAERAEALVGPDKEHWHYRFFETGAGPHAIVGRPLLWFDGENGLVRVPAVDHPGMAAKPFLRPAFDEKQEEAVGEMGQVWKAAVEAV